MKEKLLAELEAAERDAWKNLARYKFWMFGYFAARWVYLNRLIGAKRPNPFKRLVTAAREELEDQATVEKAAKRYQDAVTGADPRGTARLIEGLRRSMPPDA